MLVGSKCMSLKIMSLPGGARKGVVRRVLMSVEGDMARLA